MQLIRTALLSSYRQNVTIQHTEKWRVVFFAAKIPVVEVVEKNWYLLERHTGLLCVIEYHVPSNVVSIRIC